MTRIFSVETALVVCLLVIVLLATAQIAGATAHTFIPLLST